MYRFSIVFSFVIINLGGYFNSTPIKFLTLLIIILNILYNLHFKKAYNKFNISYLYMTLCFLTAITVLRNNRPDSSLFFNLNIILTFLLLIILYLTTIRTSLIKDSASLLLFFVKTIYLPILILVIINFIAYFIGLKALGDTGAIIGDVVLLSNFGIHLPRVNFPFTQDIMVIRVLLVYYYYSVYFYITSFSKLSNIMSFFFSE